MSEYPTGGGMAQPAPETMGEAQQVAGEQLAAAAGAPATDAGPSLEAMQAEQRAVLLPMEQQIQAMMAAFQEQQTTQAAQIAQLQAQLASAQAAAGPPAVEQYAGGVYALVKAHADANPDVARDAFAPALAAADKLRAAATDAVTSRDVAELEALSAELRRWVARGVAKHLDFSGVSADLDLLDEAAARLAA